MDSPQNILSKIRHIELRTRGIIDTAFAGQYRSVFKGRGMNFEEVREYQPGDEVRSIDWNVTARLGEVHGDAYIKKFTEERELTVVLLVDVSASGDFGSVELSKRELAAEVACVLAFSAIRNNDKVGLILFANDVELFVPPKKGRVHTLRIIREVLYFQRRAASGPPPLPGAKLVPRRDAKIRGETRPDRALEYLNRIIHHRAVTFLISDFQAPNFSRQLSITARRHDLVAIPILDRREEELPDIGLVTLQDAETGEQIEVNTSDRRVRADFMRAVEKRRGQLQKEFQRLRVDSIELRTDQDYIPALRSFFRTRERRLTLRT